MQRLIYYTIYPVLWSISKLPWRLFYGLSSCIYYLVYYIIRYRRKTVTANLTLVFPEKNTSEINRIRKAFYKHMCDMFLEMIKSISITKEEMLERFRVTNIEDFHALEKENKSIVVLMGHYASYEWSSAIDLLSINPCVGIYKKVRNPYFDKMVHRIRGRFSARLIESHDVVRTISQDIKKGDICSYGMIADQSPKIWNAKYWTDFMGVTVPVFLGASLIARKFDLTVLYLQINKRKGDIMRLLLSLLKRKTIPVMIDFITSKRI
ncbi:lysophospholipid acyltransferase family protein [Aquimarina hainanensis]|uniref:lysophospholipid acyltransferase family protein n=1 Tax=Aquimarina hainanensis TaxID=1578017 RepID=UPI003621CEC5